MRIRTPFASVAPATPAELLEQAFPSGPSAFVGAAASPSAVPTVSPKPLTLWANRSLMTNSGRAIAIRLVGADLKVGLVYAGALRWSPAKHVLSEQQAAAWARDGQFYQG